MIKEEILPLAKKTITEEIEKAGFKVVKIILFGSRARGEDREDSDWDFYVVVDKRLSFHEKWDIIDNIKIIFAKREIPNDIIIKSLEEEKEELNDVGKITFYVVKEGILI